MTVYDNDNISNLGYSIKIDGVNIASKLEYQTGHWEYDSCGEGYWIVDGYDKAIIKGTASGLKDGSHSVEAKAVDKLGNSVVKTWGFQVAAKPTISTFSPATGTSMTKLLKISAKVTDNGTVDPSSIEMTLNNVIVNHQFDPVSGFVSYDTPNSLPDGNYNVKLVVADIAGNKSDASWNFVVQAAGPQLTFAGENQKYTTANPYLTVSAKSSVKIANTGIIATLDQKTITPSFEYKGHWEHDDQAEESWYVVDSYNEAAISLPKVIWH